MSLRLTAAIAVICTACSSSTASTPPPPEAIVTPNAPPTTVSTLNETTVRTSMHDAFVDEAQWSRLYLVHTFERTSDLRLITTRLIDAEDAIASALSLVYGAALGDPLRTLLHTRANDLIAVVTAQMGNFMNPQLRERLLSNEDAIAELLASVVGVTVPTCAQSTFDQIDARARQAWVAEAQAYDATLACEIGDADALTNAMVSQHKLVPTTLGGRAESLHFSLRLLLDEDAFWTRDMLVAGGVSSQDAPAAADEAVRASNGVGTVFETFYGQDVGLEVGRQFHQATLTDGLAYMLAAKSGDATATRDIVSAWNKDAFSLAHYLSQLSPAFDATTIERFLDVWISNTKAEIDARLVRDWQTDIDAYAAVLGAARNLSFVIADDLVQAFPHALD